MCIFMRAVWVSDCNLKMLLFYEICGLVVMRNWKICDIRTIDLWQDRDLTVLTKTSKCNF